ncbi:triacylglycerol lipase [Pelomonas sp. KK5]|uniref:esterase/lipase family protein n=1 Tax=Pelomonas sp. KK5 TaxID=1855730 RepID=UPI00097C1B51|nr:alpha/beta hydrolase [Pelomonas sp. KK5]
MNRNDPMLLWSEVAARLPDEAMPPVTTGPRVAIGPRRRRGFDPADVDGRAQVELLRDDGGLLRWLYTPPHAARTGARRSYRSVHLRPDQSVAAFRFEDFGRNDVTTKLVELDQWLSGDKGMLRWRNKRFAPDPQPLVKGRTLLLIHGTFSSSQMWEKELPATEQGHELLERWASVGYEAVLAFNHHTLSVGAWSNAIDLHRALREVDGPIDVICHSRGGLVLSWLLRLAPARVERVVFVGSPLVGTSLAAPDKLRGALDLLANYADAAAALGEAAGSFMPIALGAAGLAKVLGKTLRLGSGLPIVDAAVALVPGLATQQAVSNNLELRQLFAEDWLVRPQMSGIGVAFVPKESTEPLWKVWKRFSNIGAQIKHGAADLVFPGANDLVVDVEHMAQLGERGVIDFCRLPDSPVTHHTNYFRDAAVLAELERRLG